MNKNISSQAGHLLLLILESDDILPAFLNVINPSYVRELNETYPDFHSYAIKRQFGLLRLYDLNLGIELHKKDLKAFEAHPNTLSRELRYRQLK